MIELAPLRREDIALIDEWFDDPETQIRLGDREWPRMVLTLVAPPDRIALLAWERGEPVALVDVEHLEATSFAIVVAPDRRGRGIGTAVVALLLETELAGRTLSVAAEADNHASRQLLVRHGFEPRAADEDGFVEYVRP